MTLKTKNLLIGAGVTLILGISGWIAKAYIATHTRPTPTVAQTSIAGNNINVNGNGNPVQANSGSGSSTQTNDNSLTVYNNCFNKTYVTEVFKNVATPGHQPAKGDICYVDTVNKVIHFRPRSGEWSNPFVGVPLREAEAIDPHLNSETSSSMTKRTGIDTLGGDTLRTLSMISTSASPESEILLQYHQMPTVIFFGDLKGPIFKATRREQPDYSQK